MSYRPYPCSGHMIPGTWENFKKIGGFLTPENRELYRDLFAGENHSSCFKEAHWREFCAEMQSQNLFYWTKDLICHELEVVYVGSEIEGDDVKGSTIYFYIDDEDLFIKTPLYDQLDKAGVDFKLCRWAEWG